MPEFDRRNEYYDTKTKKVVHSSFSKMINKQADGQSRETYLRGRWIWDGGGEVISLADGSPVTGPIPKQVGEVVGLEDISDKMFKVHPSTQTVVDSVEDLNNISEEDLISGSSISPKEDDKPTKRVRI